MNLINNSLKECEKYIPLITEWAEDRNLIKGSTNHAQMLKLTEEVGELIEARYYGEKNQFIDAVGDCSVVLIILMAQNNIEFSTIIESGDNFLVDKTYRTLSIDLSIELGKLSSCIAKNKDKKEITTQIKNLFVLLTILALDNSVSLSKCITAAYDEIKNRKGRMVDGVFIREE